mgnify:CR=1 FL=1
MAGEKQFEKKVERYLESVGIYQNTTRSQSYTTELRGRFFKVWGGGYQSAGVPDLIVCANGVFISIELKNVTGRPSDLQKRNTDLINQAGGLGVILYPSGFNQFKTIIEEVLFCNSLTAGLAHSYETLSSTDCGILKS